MVGRAHSRGRCAPGVTSGRSRRTRRRVGGPACGASQPDAAPSGLFGASGFTVAPKPHKEWGLGEAGGSTPRLLGATTREKGTHKAALARGPEKGQTRPQHAGPALVLSLPHPPWESLSLLQGLAKRLALRSGVIVETSGSSSGATVRFSS